MVGETRRAPQLAMLRCDAHLASHGVSDTDEKRAIGLRWEQASGGKGLFPMVEKQVGDRDMRGQLLDKIGS